MLEKAPPQRYNEENRNRQRMEVQIMERFTVKQGDGYAAADLSAAVGRLGKWEDMYESLCVELEKTAGDMAALAAKGREKSAAYRQLFAHKLTLMQLKSRLEIALG